MMERNIHPIEDRRMNIREYMHLMSLPHDFDIPPIKNLYPKLTQNVPVQTSKDILNEIKEILTQNRKLSNDQVIFIDNTTQKESKNKILF